MATTVFESPTAVGAKVLTISTTITNTSGAYSATINDERITAAMKAIKLELGTPSAFDDKISVVCNNGSMTISCSSVAGTSTAVISVIKVCEDPTEVTSSEFDVLANRIGDLDDLTTTEKTNIVDAINENASGISTNSQDIASNSQAIAKVQNGLAYIVGNTNTTGGTIAVGQFVYVKNHTTIAEGLRKVTASISANGDITTNNTASCSEGGLNALNSKFAVITGNTASDTNAKKFDYPSGFSNSNCVIVTVEIDPGDLWRPAGYGCKPSDDQYYRFVATHDSTGIYITVLHNWATNKPCRIVLMKIS